MQMKYLLLFILSGLVGFGVTTVYAQYDNSDVTPTSTVTTEPTCTPTISPVPSDEISDTPSPTAGDSATPTPQIFYPTPTEGSGGYFDDHLGCGTHSCISTPASANNIPQAPPSTGRAD